jgi:hypothetical protein
MKKGRIINLEWMRDSNHYSLEEFEPMRMDLISKEIQQAVDDGCDSILGLYLIDGFLPYDPAWFNELNKKIQILCNQLGVSKFVIVSGQGETKEGLEVPHYYFDYTFRMIFNGYRDYLPELLQTYNQQNKKFLFLGGHVARANRLGLMSRFYDAQLTSNAEWSFFPPYTPLDKEWCRNYLTWYDDTAYLDFFNTCTRSIDEKYKDVIPYVSCHGSDEVEFYDIVQTDFIKNPSYIDHQVFKQTSFSVVPEGINYWNKENKFLTEKIYRAIVNRHPFIYAAEPDQYRYLKELGYKTFEEYMLIKNYPWIEDEETRLDAIASNTTHFLANKDLYIQQITDDVEHNYNLFFEYANKQQDFFNMLEQDFKIPTSEILHYFDSPGYGQLIRNPKHGV